jgi:radical SAM protein with 4Fe4S-binding SPASM domain
MTDPFYFQWHITNFCNLRCAHCYQEDFSKNRDLDWPGLRKIADNIQRTLEGWKRGACIHLTGGEPLLKPELFSLLGELDEKPEVEELGIITNGTLLNREWIKKLSPFSKLKGFKVSLDGPDAEINDAIRPEGTFEKVIRNLSLIEGDKRFEIVSMFTVLKRNYRNLLPVMHLCQDLGIDGLIIERFIPWGRGKAIGREVLDKREWKEMVETLLDLFSIGIDEADHIFTHQAFRASFHGGEPELMGAPCVTGYDGLCIMPNGEVLPCRRFPISIGNLLNESLNEIWEQSKVLQSLRTKENLKGKCRMCNMEDCRGCRSLALALTGDPLAEDPHCWHEPQAGEGGACRKATLKEHFV